MYVCVCICVCVGGGGGGGGGGGLLVFILPQGFNTYKDRGKIILKNFPLSQL